MPFHDIQYVFQVSCIRLACVGAYKCPFCLLLKKMKKRLIAPREHEEIQMIHLYEYFAMKSFTSLIEKPLGNIGL